jgi:hypothetical protein
VRFPRPVPGEYGEFYAGYIAKAEGDVLELLTRQLDELAALWRRVGEEGAEHRYAPGKWSIKDIVGHLADAERVFVYRALRIARGDLTPLPGFDENVFVEAANAGKRRLTDLAAELAYVRRASIVFFEGLDEAAAERRGTASGYPLAVRAVPYIVAGHTAHHMDVIRTRYLT